MKTLIYADHAATTALSNSAREAMEPFLQTSYGNPSTLHSFSVEPRKAVYRSREMIAAVIHAEPDEIFFTSGGTEADNWAIKGTIFQHVPGKKVITSVIEHHAVLNTCVALSRMGYPVITLPVDTEGHVDPIMLRGSITPDVALVSVMLANNEIGTINPLGDLAAEAHNGGVLCHTDAVQAIGHISVNVNDLNVDFLSASAHKFNGPKGIGFLYVRRGTKLLPLIDGGGQELGMRSGTENVAGIVGMAIALQEHNENLSQETEYLQGLTKRLLSRLEQYHLDFRVNGSLNRVPGNLNLSFKNADAEMLLHRLDLMGTAVATGSACNSKEKELSHVIQAIHVPHDYAHGTIRITLGMDNRESDIDKIAEQIAKILS